MRTIVSVGVVLALIVVSARGLKHVMANAGQLPGGATSLRVIETTFLPSPNGRGRAAIHLVEMADGRQLLVGATDTNLSLLAELEDGRVRTAVRVGDALQAEPAPFADVLSAATEKAAAPAHLESELSDRLRRLRESAHRLEVAS
jgi:flagellar biogenesis protein FliO